jgi:hypothetical protein
MTHHECDCFGLGFAAALRCSAATLVAVHHFVREFMRQRREFLSRRLSGQ